MVNNYQKSRRLSTFHLMTPLLKDSNFNNSVGGMTQKSICQKKWQAPPGRMESLWGPKMHVEMLRNLSLRFFQDALSCLVSLFLSFPKFIKKSFYGSIRSEQSFAYIPVYPSLWTKSLASSCTFDFDQDISPKSHDIKGHPCEPHETMVGNISISPNLVFPSIPSRYKPLHLPPILHDFLAKHYKCLPKFDGESKYFTAEKHLQAFEQFSDLF